MPKTQSISLKLNLTDKQIYALKVHSRENGDEFKTVTEYLYYCLECEIEDALGNVDYDGQNDCVCKMKLK